MPDGFKCVRILAAGCLIGWLLLFLNTNAAANDDKPIHVLPERQCGNAPPSPVKGLPRQNLLALLCGRVTKFDNMTCKAVETCGDVARVACQGFGMEGGEVTEDDWYLFIDKNTKGVLGDCDAWNCKPPAAWTCPGPKKPNEKPSP